MVEGMVMTGTRSAKTMELEKAKPKRFLLQLASVHADESCRLT